MDDDWEDIPGWCPVSKRDWIRANINGEQDALEIGVYGGRSAYAIAGSLVGSSMLWTIDPFSAPAAMVEHERDGKEYADYWGKQLHLDIVRRQWLKRLLDYKLDERVRMLEVLDEQADHLFKDEHFGFMHIDGNHGFETQRLTTIRWMKKLKKGGILVIDDTNMDSVGPSIKEADKVCDRIHLDISAPQHWGAWRKR